MTAIEADVPDATVPISSLLSKSRVLRAFGEPRNCYVCRNQAVKIQTGRKYLTYRPYFGAVLQTKKALASTKRQAQLYCVGIGLLSRDNNPSTIGAGGLNDSVRKGKRWDPAAKDTNISLKSVFRQTSYFLV